MDFIRNEKNDSISVFTGFLGYFKLIRCGKNKYDRDLFELELNTLDAEEINVYEEGLKDAGRSIEESPSIDKHSLPAHLNHGSGNEILRHGNIIM